MRFHFANTTRASNLAKSLGRHLSSLGFHPKHTAMLDLVSRMTRYHDWHELSRCAGTVEASLDDDRCDPETVIARRERQVGELRSIGLTSLQAEEALTAIHPTNCRPDLAVEWHPFREGAFAVDDGIAYWVGPATPDATRSERPRVSFGFPEDEDRPFHMRYGKPAADGMKFDEAFGPHGYDSLEAGVRYVEDMIRDARLHRRDARRLSRTKLSIDEARAIDAPWGTSTEYATRYALGVLKVTCDHHGGFRVPPEVLATMPEVTRSWQDDEGFAWYEEDCQAALLMLGLPGLFTQVELRHARENAENYFPDIVAILDGKVPDDAASVRRAKRGFTEERIDWSIVSVGATSADGMVRVEAVMSDYWGENPPSYEEMTRPRTFLVPEAEWRPHAETYGLDFEIDTDRHALADVEPAEATAGLRH